MDYIHMCLLVSNAAACITTSQSDIASLTLSKSLTSPIRNLNFFEYFASFFKSNCFTSSREKDYNFFDVFLFFNSRDIKFEPKLPVPPDIKKLFSCIIKFGN